MNGWTFSTPYYLADGIHPDWTCFMTTLSNPVGNKNKLKKVIKRMLQGPLGYCRNALKYYLDIQECGVLRK
jgi:hypothetical protein